LAFVVNISRLGVRLAGNCDRGEGFAAEQKSLRTLIRGNALARCAVKSDDVARIVDS
jgi:hypothetical protein